MTVYQDLKAIGAEIDNHESDFYVKSTPEVATHLNREGIHFSYFRSAIDGSLWIDIPFMYDPFWEARTK